MANKEKCPAEMETPTGTVQITLPDYNMFSGEEQEKAEKIMELFWMTLQVNGLSDRNCNHDLSNSLPTMFVRFSGHVSSLEFSCHIHGYNGRYDSGNHHEYQVKNMYLDKEMLCFLENANYLREWLHEILEGMKHDT